MNLTTAQRDLIEDIVEYGESNGYSDEQIEIAVETAYIESSFGEALDNPASTASGPFQYLDGSWDTYHSAIGAKNDTANQIEAMFNDISTYTSWFTNPQTNGNIPDTLSLAEYVYIKHHDGRSYSDFDNAPGLAIYNAAITHGIESDIRDEIDRASNDTDNDDGGDEGDEWDNDNGDGDDSWGDGDDDWGDDDVQTWEGSYYDEDLDEWIDFEFEGTEDEFDEWLEDEGYLDCGSGGGAGDEDETDDEDPLVLDLDGDGIELININESEVEFDYNQDGSVQKTSWVSGDDGLLAIDNNKDGTINDIGELFGNRSQDGFSELSGLDSNGDGQISQLDDLFDELLVWQDKNADGVSQQGELSSLNDLGIAAISLNATETGQTSQGDGAGYVSHTSTLTFEDGSTSTVGEAWFATEQALQQEASVVYRKVSEASAEQVASTTSEVEQGNEPLLGTHDDMLVAEENAE